LFLFSFLDSIFLCAGRPWTHNLPASASWVAGITGRNHKPG
jgi:hypothetical protein